MDLEGGLQSAESNDRQRKAQSKKEKQELQTTGMLCNRSQPANLKVFGPEQLSNPIYCYYTSFCRFLLNNPIPGYPSLVYSLSERWGSYEHSGSARYLAAHLY